MRTTTNFDDDRRFCDACGSYMRFLQSPGAAYCAECGGRVRMFSPDDMATFRSSLGSKRVQALDRDTSAGRAGADEWPALAGHRSAPTRQIPRYKRSV